MSNFDFSFNFMGQSVRGFGTVGPSRTGLVLELIGDNAPSGSIANWPDTSGLGHDAIQAISASQPVKVASALNSHAVITFDGINDYFNVTLNLASSQYTNFIVFKFVGTNEGQRVIRGDNDSANFDTGATGYNMYAGATGLINKGTRDLNWHVATCAFNGDANSKLYIDGVLIATGDCGSAFPASCGLGGTGIDSTNGSLADVRIFSAALSDSVRQAWETYLGALYGITITH